uniref:CCHC-type domain-containing protein n=1 Tax=Tanacetum cinerariifolium TaxID=118510 RepID=A0A6L2NYD2_TANCI|nr:hypothetical protein [Tanacetum cinerariifolium]
MKTWNKFHLNDIEKMDLRWQMAMLTIRARRFLKKIRRKLTINENDTIGFDKSNMECYNCHKRAHFARECRALRNQDTKHKDSTRRSVPMETPASTALVSRYKLGLKSVEERLEFFKNNEFIYLEDTKVLKVKIQMKDIAIGELRKKLEKSQKENDGIQLTIEKLKNASKSLNKLIDCQIVDNCKKRLGCEKYNAVPPPYIGNFRPPKLDLSYTGLDEFTVKPVVENKSIEEETKAVRKCTDAPIIEEWVSDDEEENVTQPKIEKKIVKPSIGKKESVKPRQQEKPARKIVKKGNPQMDLQDKGVIDSGCSRHMAGNMSYLKDNKEIDGGYVAFGGNPKGAKITRVPRKNNMYSVDLKNIIPKGGLTCLFAKVTSDESELWHKRYSLNSKAFRVFNSRTRIVEENLHIRFSKSTPNVVGSGPDWLFDIDELTRTMNYELVVAGTQSNGFVDPKSSHDDGFKPSSDDRKKVDEDPSKVSECKDKEKEDNVNSTNTINLVSSTVNAAGTNGVNVIGELPFDPDMPALEDVGTFDFSNEDEDDDVVADMNNYDRTIQVSPTSTTRIHKDHPLDQMIRDLHSVT